MSIDYTELANRRITYYNQLANSLSALQDQRSDMVSKCRTLQAILGTNTLLDGFAATPGGGLTVAVGPGCILQFVNVDNTPFGTSPSQIPADTTHQILKYAYDLDAQPNITFTPPSTVGYSRNDLIQITLQEADGNNQSIPFWNGTNGAGVPNPPVNQAVNLNRICSVVVAVKSGVAAPTGTQVTPSPDSGYVGAWVITTTQGQSVINSGNIVAYIGSYNQFITEKLQDKISEATADTLYPRKAAIQAGSLVTGADTGTANTYVTALTPALTTLNIGTRVDLKIANSNTGASTLNVNGLGATAIKRPNGAAVQQGDLPAGMIAKFEYDGTYWQLLNPSLVSLLAATADPGYTYLPNNLIMQWGVVTVPANNVPVTVTLPVTFPNGGLSKVASFLANATGGGVLGISFASTSQISLTSSDPSVSQSASWLVIGY